MVIAFPSQTLVQGQLFTAQNGVTYQWDGAKWNSRLQPSYANLGGNVSETPPENPSQGTFWWNSASGQLYIYYVDSNSQQWMNASVLGTVYDSLGNVVTNSYMSQRNLPSGTYDLSLALEGEAVYDSTVQMGDLGINLELGQNLVITDYDQTVTESDTD